MGAIVESKHSNKCIKYDSQPSAAPPDVLTRVAYANR
jgi:hypothetical protein